MAEQSRHVLVAGASGVIGSAAVEHFAACPGWRVSAVSRRPPVLPEGCAVAHLPLDLLDRDACADAIARLPPVTHLVYAAVAEAPGLVGGWYDEALIARNGAMFANILDPLAAAGALRHVSLLQGTKAYGAHHHTVELPSRESRPRDPHPNFYWLHEDHARLRAAEANFAFTIFRPQVLLGAAPGVAMNPVAPIGAYAALCRELGRPFSYPGGPNALWELVDTGLVAEAFVWAASSEAASGEIFNITNGDVFAPAHAWPHLARALGLPVEGAAPQSLVAFFAEPEVVEAWSCLVARHGLRVADLPSLLGESHHYVDLLLGARIAERPMPVLLSTIKLRQSGFGACRDSLDSLLFWLGRMEALRLLPPRAG